jgi:hypothetical protein
MKKLLKPTIEHPPSPVTPRERWVNKTTLNAPKVDSIKSTPMKISEKPSRANRPWQKRLKKEGRRS